MSRVLGAVLAGGASRRFGSDKALADIGGITMIDRVIAALAPQVDAVVICGRQWRTYASLPDRPQGQVGPLAAINAALHHAAASEFDCVLSAPCDTPTLPGNLRETLGAAPAYWASLPVLGLWPTGCAAALDGWLLSNEDRSMRAWAASIGARPIPGFPLDNINTRSDLDALTRRQAP